MSANWRGDCIIKWVKDFKIKKEENFDMYETRRLDLLSKLTILFH